MYGINDNSDLDCCQLSLQDMDLWKKFQNLQTEMVITKGGRRMFPLIRLKISGLNPAESYCVFVEMMPATDSRYRYSASTGWIPAGGGEPQSTLRFYLHPDSPATGEHWMSQVVNFSRLKLTNNPKPPDEQLVLNSMHKYQPRIIIAKTIDPKFLNFAPSIATIFTETSFITVTAYQNDRITNLKIYNNPFARGFRENGRSKCKRKRINTEDEQNEEPRAASPALSEKIDVCSLDVSSSEQGLSNSPHSSLHHENTIDRRPIASPNPNEEPVPIKDSKPIPFSTQADLSNSGPPSCKTAHCSECVTISTGRSPYYMSHMPITSLHPYETSARSFYPMRMESYRTSVAELRHLPPSSSSEIVDCNRSTIMSVNTCPYCPNPMPQTSLYHYETPPRFFYPLKMEENKATIAPLHEANLNNLPPASQEIVPYDRYPLTSAGCHYDIGTSPYYRTTASMASLNSYYASMYMSVPPPLPPFQYTGHKSAFTRVPARCSNSYLPVQKTQITRSPWKVSEFSIKNILYLNEAAPDRPKTA